MMSKEYQVPSGAEHPITPPPELIAKWAGSMCGYHKAARWGADQELEACCEWLAIARNHSLSWEEATNYSANLLAARRPKPPSLKEQALARTDAILNDPNRALLVEVRETLELNRRALEQLDD